MKENTNREFKSSFNDSVIETLSAFANTKGGKVIIGLNDKGEPLKNFTIGYETIQQWINEIKNKTQPSIIADADIKTIKGKTVVELVIQEFPVKPIAFKQRFYKRVNNSNHSLSATEISDMYMQSLQVSWDSYPYHKATIKQLSVAKINAFIKKVNDGGRFSLPTQASKALVKLKLINATSVSRAAMILLVSKIVKTMQFIACCFQLLKMNTFVLWNSKEQAVIQYQD